MKVVIDANVLISALLSGGATSDALFAGRVEFIAPLFILREVNKYWDDIAERSGISENELKQELEEIKPQITFFSSVEYNEFLSQAYKILPDPKDVAYFALALKFNCPIWSYDPHFFMQTEIRVLKSAKEVLKFIEELGSN